MASERDERQYELEKRRQARQERAAQRKKQQKARRDLMLRLGGVVLVIIMVTGLIFWVSRNAGNQGTEIPGQTAASGEVSTEPAQTQQEQTQSTQQEQTQPTEQEPTTVIHIKAAGDLNITDQVISNAAKDGTYDFTRAFLEVAPVLTDADLTLLNFEGTLAGEPYGAERGSAPAQLVEHLASIGVDVVQTANSASIRAGVLGLQSTIDGFYNAGILPVGTFANKDTFRKTGGYSIVDVQGIRVAFVGFTKGMDNLGLPEGSEDCVNLLYKDYTTDYKKVDEASIERVLGNVEKEHPDLTIALVHWGSENNEEISPTQIRIRDLMLSKGVDVILGTHPHLVQSIDYDPDANTLVAYSLGDFYGDAAKAGTNYSLILDLEITRDNVKGVTKITGYDYTPIFTLLPEQSGDGGQRVVQIHDAMTRYENNYLGKVTEEVYDSMNYALKRLNERVNAEVEE